MGVEARIAPRSCSVRKIPRAYGEQQLCAGRMLNHALGWPSQASLEGQMDTWPLVISFSAIAAAIFAYGFLIAA